jgi:hypothetical protein
MPRLIVNRSRNRRKVPPCGRLIVYREPSSPFQKLIDDARRRYGLSGYELARKMTLICPRAPVSQSTLWIWLHSMNGYPHPKSFKSEHLRALSRILKIPQDKITRAIDASRHIYSPKEQPMPHESLNAFGRFIDILEHDNRVNVNRRTILHLAKTLYNGAQQTR